MKNISMTLIAVLTLAFLDSASANSMGRDEASCSPVDLRGSRLGPIRNTSTINWSYAHATADLLTQSIPLSDEQRFSAEALALELQRTHLNQRFQDAMAGRNFFTQVVDGRSIGFDRKNNVANNPGTPARLIAHHQGAETFLCLESEVGGANYAEADATELFNLMDNSQTIFRGRRSQNLDCDSPEAARFNRMFPGLDFEDLVESLRQGAYSSTMFFLELKDKACKTRTSISQSVRVQESQHKPRDREAFLTDFHRALDRDELALISYNGSVLREGSSDVSFSTIAGRRFQNGVCQVLVRTTQGSQCDFKSHLDCEDGHVWISQEELYPHVERTLTLESPSAR